MGKTLTIGVLALQGAFQKHIDTIKLCGEQAIPVRTHEELDSVQGLIIPGGESTTIGKLLARYNLDKKIIEATGRGMPIFGTCAGLILLAKEIVGSDQHRLGLLDVTVLRNAFGRQVDSFEVDLDIEALGKPPFRAIFIRAPYVEKANPGVEVLARCNEKIVFVKQKNLLGAAFHPELTTDTRIHEYFIRMVQESQQ
ncbi:MAG: pyridoxal 5'-phosphate synthase glutaminase subunit PdxT [Armatimonadota bacterium]|nr:pyridoxal 5'-phosphate synthase glutaminase subunit PdxT [Armatimonadota bacterium]